MLTLLSQVILIFWVCENRVWQMCLHWLVLCSEGGLWKKAGHCAASANHWSFLHTLAPFLQAADMRAIIKRHHPQLHLTLNSPDTAHRELRHQLLFTSHVWGTILSRSCVEFTAFIHTSRVFVKWMSQHGSDTLHCPADSGSGVFFFLSWPGYASLALLHFLYLLLLDPGKKVELSTP